MVVLMVIFFRYLPLAADGLARQGSRPARARVVLPPASRCRSSPWPITRCRLDCLSTRKLILAALDLVDRLGHGPGVTVPVFGFGNQAHAGRAPRAIRARPWPSGPAVAIAGVEVQPATLDAGDQVPPSRPRRRRRRWPPRPCRPPAERRSPRAGPLPVTVRQVHGASDHLVGLAAGSTTQAHGPPRRWRPSSWRRCPWPARRLSQRAVQLVAVDLLGCLAVAPCLRFISVLCRSGVVRAAPRLSHRYSGAQRSHVVETSQP